VGVVVFIVYFTPSVMGTFTGNISTPLAETSRLHSARAWQSIAKE
jgi:hypothetical protein